MKVSISSLFPEKDKGDVIFGSLKDQTKGVEGRGTWDGDTHGGIGRDQEPED